MRLIRVALYALIVIVSFVVGQAINPQGLLH